MRRFEPTWPLHFVTAKNFRIRHNDQLRCGAKKSARQRAEIGDELFVVGKTKLFPNFLEPLTFAVVVAENLDGKILPQPAVELREKFPALCLGDRWFRRALAERTKGFKRIQLQIERFASRTSFAGFRFVHQFRRGDTTMI